jgi:glutamate 5-kinase
MRDFSKVKRVVIKVGTNVLSKNAGVDTDFLRVIASQISELLDQGRQVILVTSGAIGMGMGALGLNKKVTLVKLRQACAAVGQGILMHEYQQAFSGCGRQTAQILLTNAIMSNRRYYVNLKNTVEMLLDMSVVPIVNENDCVSIDEIDLAFGDNDKLSALVASKADAELLIMLTDVDGFFNANPRKNAQAELLSTVYEITDEMETQAGSAGTQVGTGGMKSKLAAIRIAAQAGCRVVLANGREKDVILRIIQGHETGTLFLPKRKLSNRKRWILNSRSNGRIEIDPGAAEAVKNSRSLLLVGISSVEGSFKEDQVVDIAGIAKGICDVSASQLRTMLSEAKDKSATASSGKPRAIIHANNIVVL